MVENENSPNSISSPSPNETAIPRWVYVSAMFIVIFVMFIMIFQHHASGAVVALFSIVILIYTVQNQQIEELSKRLTGLETRSEQKPL